MFLPRSLLLIFLISTPSQAFDLNIYTGASHWAGPSYHHLTFATRLGWGEDQGISIHLGVVPPHTTNGMRRTMTFGSLGYEWRVL